jgi:hypothetical protein
MVNADDKAGAIDWPSGGGTLGPYFIFFYLMLNIIGMDLPQEPRKTLRKTSVQ